MGLEDVPPEKLQQFLYIDKNFPNKFIESVYRAIYEPHNDPKNVNIIRIVCRQMRDNYQQNQNVHPSQNAISFAQSLGYDFFYQQNYSEFTYEIYKLMRIRNIYVEQINVFHYNPTSNQVEQVFLQTDPGIIAFADAATNYQNNPPAIQHPYYQELFQEWEREWYREYNNWLQQQ